MTHSHPSLEIDACSVFDIFSIPCFDWCSKHNNITSNGAAVTHGEDWGNWVRSPRKLCDPQGAAHSNTPAHVEHMMCLCLFLQRALPICCICQGSQSLGGWLPSSGTLGSSCSKGTQWRPAVMTNMCDNLFDSI